MLKIASEITGIPIQQNNQDVEPTGEDLFFVSKNRTFFRVKVKENGKSIEKPLQLANFQALIREQNLE